MDLQITQRHREQIEAFRKKHRTALLSILFTDIAGSTRIKQELGDTKGVALIQRYRQLVRDLLKEFSEGEEIETAGDSFLIVFVKPSDAVKFSIRLQKALREFSREAPLPVQNRLGVHLGEVVIEERVEGPKPIDLYGIQLDIGARVMSLGQGDQILMTRSVFDNARQVLKGQEIETIGELSWLNHGPYVLKGVEEPVEICEVGEEGIAVLSPPADSEKAYRHISPGSEPVLGWRPALGQIVPTSTEWVLEEKLGEGGFGEVWKARHRKLKECRVFKFCFRADRVRSLKREVTLFRVLKDRIGEHPNIVRLHDVFFDEPPYYIVTEYVEGKDLISWSEERGGVETIPLETCLEIVAQAAEALQAAHEAGVIHRDVKPSNILIDGDGTSPENIQVKLTDFGIGQVVSDLVLAGMTQIGFTQTMFAGDSGSQSGTHLYMAPELIAGKPASIRSDIYSIGVVLYQLLIGDLSRPLALGWTENIDDPLVKDDIAHCCTENPQDRFVAAGQLARQLNALNERRKERAGREAAERRAIRRRRLTMVTSLLLGIITLLSIALGYGLWREKIQREIAEREQYYANIGFAGECIKNFRFGRAYELLMTCPVQHRNWEWGRYLLLCNRDLFTLYGHTDQIHGLAFSPDGKQIAAGSRNGTVKVWDTGTCEEISSFTGHCPNMIGGGGVSFTPDGKSMVSLGSDNQGTVRVWDVKTAQEIFSFNNSSGVIFGISPDGTRIITGVPGDITFQVSQDEIDGQYPLPDGSIISGSETIDIMSQDEMDKLLSTFPAFPSINNENQPDVPESDRTAKVWDAKTGQLLFQLEGHSGGVTSAAFSPDGKRIVTGSIDKTAKVWDADTGKELINIAGRANPVTGVYYTIDGTRIFTISGVNTVKFFDAETGQEIFPHKRNFGEEVQVVISPDGKRIIILNINNYTITLLDAETNREINTFKEHSGPVSIFFSNFPFSFDGKYFAIGSMDNTAIIMDLETGEKVNTFQGHAGLVSSVAFSPNGQHIATGSRDGTVKVWDTDIKKETIISEDGYSPGDEILLSSDGKYIALKSYTNTTQAGDAETGRKLFDLKGSADRVRILAFGPDGKYLLLDDSVDKTVNVFEIEGCQEIISLKEPHVVDGGFSPDGKRIYTRTLSHEAGGVTEPGTLKVWDIETAQLITRLEGQSDNIGYVTFDPNGQRIFAGYFIGNHAKIFNANSGQELCHIEGVQNRFITAEFSPDGDRIAVNYGNWAGKVLDSETGKEIIHLEGSQGLKFSWAFSPNSKSIASGCGNNIVKVWNLETGQELMILDGHIAPVESVAFSSDGKRIVSGSRDSTAKIWDAKTGQELMPLLGHSSAVESVAFSPDGKRVFTGSGIGEGTVKVWDAVTGREIVSLDGLSKSVRSLSFNPSGNRLIAEYEFSVPKVWNAFPWRINDYPGDSSVPLKKRIERYKREYWKKRFGMIKPIRHPSIDAHIQ